MGQLPITSRLKRVPSALKAAGTPKAKIIKKGDDEEKIITVPGVAGTENLDKLNAGKIDKGPDYDPPAAETARANAEVAAAKAADVAAAKPTQKKIVVKGEDVIADTYSKREGKVQTNFDGRQIGRATKFKNKYVRQSQNKLARADDRMAKFQKKYMVAGVDADGKANSTFKAPKAGDKGYKKYKRLEAKQTENTNELADFKAGASNQAEAVRSGKSIGSTTRMDVDRQDTAGDQSPEQRLAQVKAEKRAEAATEGGITTSNSQSAGAITSTTPATGGPKDQFNVGELEGFDPTKFGQYSATTSPNNKRGYAMKGKNPAPAKSALKKSYFKNK